MGAHPGMWVLIGWGGGRGGPRNLRDLYMEVDNKFEKKCIERQLCVVLLGVGHTIKGFQVCWPQGIYKSLYATAGSIKLVFSSL